MTTSGDVFDQAHAMEADVRDMTDGTLRAELRLAALDERLAKEKYDDLQEKIESIRQAHGPGGADKLMEQEFATSQALNMARLRLMTAEGEQRRRQEAGNVEAAQRAQVARAQQLADLRAQAWDQYVRDAGHRLDGVSLADEATFRTRWAEFLVDLSLGRVTLPA